MLLKQIFILIQKLTKKFCLVERFPCYAMISDPNFEKLEFFTLEGAVFKNSTNYRSAFYIFRKKLSKLDFWFSSYDHFSDIICKTLSSGQNVFSLFLDNFFLICAYLVKETSILKLRFCCSATRRSNLLFISKLRIDYSYIHHLS